MKRDVVQEKLLRVLQGRKHLRDLFRHRRQLFAGRAFRRQPAAPTSKIDRVSNMCSKLKP